MKSVFGLRCCLAGHIFALINSHSDSKYIISFHIYTNQDLFILHRTNNNFTLETADVMLVYPVQA